MDLQHRREVGDEDPAGAQGRSGAREHPPGLRDVEHDPVDVGLLHRLVDTPDLDLQVLGLAQERLDVRPGQRGKVLPQFVGDHPAFGAHRPHQRHRERPRAGPGLEDVRPRVDIAVEQHHRQVLRVDHLRPPLHLQDELGEGRAQGDDRGAARRPHRDALGPADQQVVGDDPAVEVVRLALLQGDEVAPATVVQQQDPLPRLEARYRQLSTPTS